MNWHRAYYSVIQYCPDLGRREAANVGVVLFCPELHYLDARTVRANDRIKKFFGHTGHDWKQINAFKNGIAERVCRATDDVRDQDSFKHFVALQANLMQLTDPMPCKASDNPKDDLDRLFSELVSEEKRKEKGRSLRTLLGDRFERAGIGDKLRKDISVRVPVLKKDMDIPYGFQNGRLNLVTPVGFEAKETDTIVGTACKYAVEGRSLYEHHDEELGELQLVIVGKFRDSDTDGKAAAHRVFQENSVDFYTFDRVPDLIDVIRRTGKTLSQ